MDKENVVYFFTGGDAAKKSLSINKIKSKLSLTSESLDYDVYYGEDTTAPDIIRILKTHPFLASRRLVILKQGEKLSEDDKQKLTLYFKAPFRSSIFIITTEKGLNANDKLHIAAKRYAKCIDFPILKQDSISPQDSAFRLVDEIGLKKKELALQTLSLLMRSGKEPLEILGLIAWYIRRLGKVKVLLKKGGNKEKIAKDLKMGFYRAQKTINQAKNFNFKELRRAQHLLIETDRSLKKSISTPEVMLEMLIVRLSSGL